MSDKAERIAGLLGITVTKVRDVLETVPFPPGSMDTVEQALKAFHNAPSDSEARRLALEKWIALCATIEQAREAFNNAPYGSEIQEFAFKKWNELSLAEVEAANTIEQIRKAFNNTPNSSEARRLAILKIAELMPD